MYLAEHIFICTKNESRSFGKNQTAKNLWHVLLRNHNKKVEYGQVGDIQSFPLPLIPTIFGSFRDKILQKPCFDFNTNPYILSRVTVKTLIRFPFRR